MLKNYLKIAVRTLRQQPVYTAINVVGLALGMSVCLLIIVLVEDQRSYDRFHEHADRIYRVTTRFSPSASMAMAKSPGYVGPRLASDVPAVEHVVRLADVSTNVVHEGTSLQVDGLYAEAPFFDVFGFELLAGNPSRALAEPHQLVLSEVLAEQLFGETNPLGEVVTLEQEGTFTVTGVVATRGLKSHLSFDLLASLATAETMGPWQARMQNRANAWSYANYVLLREGASPQAVQLFLDGLSARNERDFAFELQALDDIALGPVMRNYVSARPTVPLVVVLFLGGLGLVVMLTAGFNYVGLTVARSLQRAREVAVRKTVGATRRQVVTQFLTESVVLALLAVVVAAALLAVLVPGFNNLSVVASDFGIRLSPEAVYEPRLIGIFILFSGAVGLLAGLYPALYLSKFEPARVIENSGRIVGAGRLTLRKVLIVLQLTVTLALVVTTVLLYRQFDHMIETDYGFDTTHLISLELQGNDPALLYDELLRDASIREVAAASGLPGLDGVTHTSISRPGLSDTLYRSGFLSAETSFFDALDLEMAAGERWRASHTGAPGVILNETAARQLGFDRPEAALGQTVQSGMLRGGQPVVGVVTDFRFRASWQTSGPLVMVNDPQWFQHLLVRVHPGGAARALDHLKTVWPQVDPVHPIAFGFYDAQLRENEGVRLLLNLLKVVGPVAAMALAILCMGLVGLATYSVQTRTKEVGIRKVLGASVPSVVWLLSKEFLLLLTAAVMLGTPLVWFVNNLWLTRFGNRVDFGAGIFAVGIGVVTLVVLAVVGAQTTRAALADPVESLRYE